MNDAIMKADLDAMPKGPAKTEAKKALETIREIDALQRKYEKARAAKKHGQP